MQPWLAGGVEWASCQMSAVSELIFVERGKTSGCHFFLFLRVETNEPQIDAAWPASVTLSEWGS